jgi:SPP1 family predicted phage head-tail adaptor
MRAYRHPLTIQLNTPTRSTRGAEVDSWTTLASVLGDVSPLGSREFYAAQQTNSEIVYEVRLHYRPDVTSGMRILWNGQTLEIVGPPRNLGSRNRDMIARCRVIEQTSAPLGD